MAKPRSDASELTAMYQAVLALQTVEECRLFFDDICTKGELASMAQRLKVAMLLSENETFFEIAAQTGASSATISRVNKCLQYGDGGYRTVLERVSKK